MHKYYISLITYISGTTADSSSSITAKNKVDYRSYVYDNLKQLIRENNKTSNTTTLFTYDGMGNIKTKKVYGYTTGTVYTLTKTVTHKLVKIFKNDEIKNN